MRIAGQSSFSQPGGTHGFFWEPIVFTSDPNERLIDVGDLGGGSGKSYGFGITGSDPAYFVVGSSETNTYCSSAGHYFEKIRGFKWDRVGQTMTELSTATDNSSVAYDIREESGETLIGGGDTVCGENGCPYDVGDAVAWIDLAAATLAQPPLFNNIEGEARDLNDAGNLVGWGTDPTNNCRNRPLYWDDPAAIGVILETVPAGDAGRALGINSNKDVVGKNSTTGAATLWDSTVPGTWIYSDLNDLISMDCGWDLVEARAINDNGWIVGWGEHDGAHRAFLLTPLDDFCPADFDGNGEVNTSDLLILFANWGDCPDASDGKLCVEDINADCTVNTTDLLLLFADWGPCGQQGGSIPQNVQDCLDRYCCAPEDLLALEKCICAVDPDCDPNP